MISSYSIFTCVSKKKISQTTPIRTKYIGLREISPRFTGSECVVRAEINANDVAGFNLLTTIVVIIRQLRSPRYGVLRNLIPRPDDGAIAFPSIDIARIRIIWKMAHRYRIALSYANVNTSRIGRGESPRRNLPPREREKRGYTFRSIIRRILPEHDRRGVRKSRRAEFVELIFRAPDGRHNYFIPSRDVEEKDISYPSRDISLADGYDLLSPLSSLLASRFAESRAGSQSGLICVLRE